MSSLTIALINKPPVQIIKALLEVEPNLSSRIDRNGMTSLHIACLFGSSSEVIQLLIEHDDGRTASALDFSRKVPLHYSAEYICHPVDNFQSLVLDMYASTTTASSKKNSNSRVSIPTPIRQSRSSVGSLSTKSVRIKRQGSTGSSGTVISMGQDHFKDQVNVIQQLLSVAPNTVHCADIHGNTPLDILHDCKAEYAHGPKWERADIVSELFREISIALYRHQKEIWEREGNACMDDVLSDKSCTYTVDGSSAGLSSLSALEIGQLSLTHMDLSVYSKEKGSENVPMLEKYLRGDQGM